MYAQGSEKAEGYEWNGRKPHRNARQSTSQTYRNARQSTSEAERTFALMVQDLEALRAQGSRFDAELLQWQMQRQDTIAAVEGLKEKLEAVGTVAEVARGAGSAAIIAGSFASLVGAIMEMNMAEGSDKWMEAGEGLKKFGEMAIPGTTLLELGISEMFMNNVKRVLRQDRELSEPLNELMQTSRRLDGRMQQTIGCGLNSPGLTDTLSTFATSLSLMQSGKSREAYGNVRGSGSTFTKFSQLAEGLGEASLENVLGLVEKVSDFFSERPNTVRLCRSGLELGAALRGGSARKVAPVMAAADMGFRQLGLNPGQARCGLEAVRMAAEVVHMVSRARDVAENRSRYCEELEDLVCKLKREFDEVSASARRR